MRAALLAVALALVLAGCQVPATPTVSSKETTDTCDNRLLPTIAYLKSEIVDVQVNVFSRSHSRRIIAYFNERREKKIDAEFVYTVVSPIRPMSLILFVKNGCIVDDDMQPYFRLLLMLREALATPV